MLVQNVTKPTMSGSTPAGMVISDTVSGENNLGKKIERALGALVQSSFMSALSHNRFSHI